MLPALPSPKLVRSPPRTPDPARADSACAVDLPKEGPVHSVAWAPGGDCFVVAAGFMPVSGGCIQLHLLCPVAQEVTCTAQHAEPHSPLRPC